jgi:FlaA1/EpsC-like NDP-sugar epimerase
MPALSRTTPVNKEPDMPNDVNTEINAVQAGDRLQPEDLPAQHLDDKPSLEAQLQLKPQFLAPGYVGSQKLAGKTALITGGDSGIGRAVAVLFAREGANVAIIYFNEHEDAQETARLIEQEGQASLLIPGDVKDPDFCISAV